MKINNKIFAAQPALSADRQAAGRFAPLREIKIMKILNPSQLQKADAYTIKHQAISSWQLMERASLDALEEIKEILVEPKPVTILAGSGNNGGDGLAIAYHLDQLGYKVNVLILKYTMEYLKDCKINLDRLQAKTKIKVEEFTDDSNLESLSFQSIIIDAIFGIGLNRALPEFVKKAIDQANQAKVTRISIDVPSGLFLSELTPENSVVFQADFTLTFQCPKLNFFLPDYGNSLGQIKIIDIGLDQDFISELNTDYIYVDQHLAKTLLKPRQRFSHKGSYGHLLVIGGQYGMMGSVSLTTRAALRSGAGKVSVLSPKCGVGILQKNSPEAMVISSEHDHTISTVQLDFKPNHICIGMGIGRSSEAKEALTYFIQQADTPMLIDADGLNLLAKDKSLLNALPSKSILTPHQGELKRLIGDWSDQYDKLDKMKQFVRDYDVVLVAKDAYTFIVDKDRTYINSTGNAGMATAGSGDTLSGIISGLLVQGYSSIQASMLGVYLHGLAADLWVKRYDENSLIASDIIDYLKNAFSFAKK